MCGIAGILDFSRHVDPDRLDGMVDSLEHRGPDDRGTFVENSIALGMRRLSVIDVSCGHQPIFNETENLVIVYNGEIYNYLELREELLEKGHTFRTNSDSETILHAFEEWGPACLDRMYGMFAFAIWNRTSCELFLARDRFGIKPLFYQLSNSGLLFGSEVRAILSALESLPNLDPNTLELYFTFLYPPGETTFFSNIKKLLPGHWMRLSQENGGTKCEIQRYYQLPTNVSIAKDKSFEAYLEEFFDIGRRTLKRHLISDVPVGAFLSGGIDSTIVVGLMSQLMDVPVETFSIGYDESGASFDETNYARTVSQQLGTNHHEMRVQPHDVIDSLPEILRRLDEPFANASVIPNYLLSKFARSRVTVCLSGLGGDEVCGGYERYLGAKLANVLGGFRGLFASQTANRLVNLIPDSSSGGHLPERLKRFVTALGQHPDERYFSIITKLKENQRESFFSPQFLSDSPRSPAKLQFLELWSQASQHLGLNRLLAFDFSTYLVDDLLALSDRTSMAHSLEMRVPFLDHELVEFFWRTPEKFKIRGTTKKYLLKKAAERFAPREVIYRKKKGFSVPLSVWFRKELKSYLHESLISDALRSQGIFQLSAIEKLLDEHYSAQRNHDETLYALLSFSEWLQTLRSK